MTPRPPRIPRFRLSGPIILFLYFIAVWYLSRFLEPDGGPRLWTIRIILWAIGLAAFGLIIWFKRRANKQEAAPAGRAREVDDQIEKAEARLEASPEVTIGALDRMPLAVVLGPPGSAKTTAVLRSGLEPELLAGQAMRGNVVCSTESLNLWYAQGTVFVEPAGALMDDGPAWRRLLKRIQRERIAPVVIGRPQAPRAALVCIGCDEFFKAGASEVVPRAGRELRARLVEMSESLGVRLPVYVLFTKTDTLPFFGDYVRGLTREEAREVLGVTLRVQSNDLNGAYSEREYRRMSESMGRLFRALSERRLNVIGRERHAVHAAGAYEFPREFRRINEIASRFLVELCRPSELAVSPFLRGFYFTGVRATYVADPGGAHPASPSDLPVSIGATRLFDSEGAAAGGAPALATALKRKVPQWLFLERVFREVMLKDRVAMAITQRGKRVDALRRAGLVALSALSLVLAIGLIFSFAGNRSLLNSVIRPARELRSVVSNEPDVPHPETLAALEELRSAVETLEGHRTEGRPLRLAWGLYSGDEAMPHARAIYVAQLGTILMDPARERMSERLRNVPRDPGTASAFAPTFELLKSYLMTTTDVEELDSAFLTSRLPSYWLDSRRIDGESMDLANRQFGYFSGSLCRKRAYEGEHPCGATADARLVERAQNYLGGFNAADRVYQGLLASASHLQSVRFGAAFPEARDVLRDDFVVPGAFTRAGWTVITSRLSDPGKAAVAEAWVLGEHAPTADDRARLAFELRRRYETDFNSHWLSFIRGGAVVGYRNLRDADRKLEKLSDIESPLLQMLALAASHTAVDSGAVTRAFQPLHAVVTPGSTDRYLNDANRLYVNSLIDLQLSVADAAAAVGTEERNSFKSSARGKAGALKASVAQLSQAFSIDGFADPVGEAIRAVLRAPADSILRHLGTVSPLRERVAQINREAARFCRAFDSLLAKYPFNPRARTEATLDELAAIFEPGNGELNRFYTRVLSDLVVKQGSNYAVTGAAPTPTSEFVSFLNGAARVGDAMWPAGAREPQLTFFLKMSSSDAIPRVDFALDGRRRTWTRTSTRLQRFDWYSRSAREASLSGDIDGRDERLLQFDGQWSAFKLFHRARWRRIGDSFELSWSIPEHSTEVRGELNFTGGPPVLMPDFFSELRCVRTAVR